MISESSLSRGVGISTFNRASQIREVTEAVLATVPKHTLVVVSDDGSTDETPDKLLGLPIVYIRGVNHGVVANKNRILTTLRNCSLIALMEDDLMPQEGGWYEAYETALVNSGIHHFCRVQGKEVDSETPDFDSYMVSVGCTPLYSSSCRGDLVFLSRAVLDRVGGLNPSFRGVGYGHQEWSQRVYDSGLIPHPKHKWIDIKEARDKFVQIGDTEGGRFDFSEQELKKQLDYNKRILEKARKAGKLYVPIKME